MSIIYSRDFKSLIDGTKTKSEVYEIQIRHGHHVPDISIEYVGNQIIVKGDFELLDDLEFNVGENYSKEILFDGGTYKNIIFRGGHFKKLLFRRGTYNGYVSIRGGNIEYLLLLGGNFTHWLGTLDGWKNSENGEKLAEEELTIGRFEIEGGSYTNNIWISGGKIDSLEVKCVSPIKLHCKPSDDKEFNVSQNRYTQKFDSFPEIKNLIISRYSHKDNFFHFSELTLDTIKFENFTNIGNITISRVKLDKYIRFENADLGKTTFIDCNFSTNKLFFDSSKITDISLAGVELPKPPNIESIKKNDDQKRLVLSQLKKAYQNMGDSVSALQYLSEELNTYRKSLPWGEERLNLSLNYYSNRFGQSWKRALIMLLTFSTTFYIIYCFSLGFHLDLSRQGITIFFRNAAYLIEFINPIRKSTFLPEALVNIKEEAKIPAATVFIDSVSKIIQAYLIYQFIAAFRKHGKKSE